ncbi:iron-sulfur cluster assembly scaffold protein [Legionella sp. CNM-4043-24]|uniref:iron-sulfur cluster assembly scaffold protein n=1 Tax=Legionella sp. CNM-4043-24 TaxID=3421646 RepID=UPI00403AF6B1
MNYNKTVEQYFFQARHAGTLDTRQANTVMCRMGEKAHGACFELYLSCLATGEIVAARFLAYGNPYVIAGLEWLCTEMQGTFISEHPRLDYHEIVRKLAIPATQYAVAVLIERGYQSVVEKMNERLQGKQDEC